jgi:tetratricopeptide (TPR) repeat protein
MGLTDFFRPKWKHSNKLVRQAVVEKVTDQAILAQVARTDAEPAVRSIAVRNLTDQAVLAQIARTDDSPLVRRDAVQAAQTVADPAFFAGIAKNDKHEDVREAALKKVSDQALLAEIARSDRSQRVRLSAVSGLTDQRALAELVETQTGRVREAAEGKLTDRTLRARASSAFADDCFRLEFQEVRDHRRLLDGADAREMIKAQRAGNLAAALREAEGLCRKYPDCHSFYYWLGYLHAEGKRYQESRAVLLKGIQQAREKASLYDRLARTEWESGDLREAVKWWTRSLVVRVETGNFDDTDPFLYLSYVADGLGMAAESRVFRRHTRTDLVPEVADRIRRAAGAAFYILRAGYEPASAGKAPGMREALSRACAKLEASSASDRSSALSAGAALTAAKPAAAGAPGPTDTDDSGDDYVSFRD